MKIKKATYLISLFFTGFFFGQECPELLEPIDGAIDVPVNSTIRWTVVEGVPSYLISLGTQPGGTDIIDNQSTGSAQFTPELGLPESTEIYVTVTLFFFNRDNIVCQVGKFTTEDVLVPPECPPRTSPEDGVTGVSTTPIISWDYAPTATGYIVSMGTTPQGSNIIDNEVVLNALSYEVVEALPFETEIFVRIVPFNENGEAQNCSEFSFVTEAEVFLPACTQLTSPADGELNVPLTPTLEWDAVPNASGYRVSIGTSPTNNDVIDNAPYTDNTTEVINFLPSSTFYVTISPFNNAGTAMGCAQTSFTTLLGCGPVQIPTTGEIVSFGPDIDFPQEVALCANENTTIITSDDSADGYRWFKVNADQSETLLSETATLSLTELGQYRYEAYNLVDQLGDIFECSASQTFNVIISELPRIIEVETFEDANSLRVQVTVGGIGDYEYAIDDQEGPYQESNVFTDLALGRHTVYVRDKNGCGIAQETVFKGLTTEGFPLFFTPNGDGINDFWQFEPPDGSDAQIIESLRIYDRFGTLLTEIEPRSKGWDGSFNGVSLPSADYWYKAVAVNKKEVRGHFTLKR